MGAADDLLVAVEAIYDACLDESAWCTALEKMIGVSRSQAATFWVLDGSAEPHLPIFRYINFDAQFIATYLDHMAANDPTVQYLVGHPGQGVVHDGLVITEREKVLHPYYDWHQRHSDTHFRLLNQVEVAPQVHAGVALHRARSSGRYEQEDLDRFDVLHRHIRRALTMSFRVGTLGTMKRCSEELLDRNPAAIVLLDTRRNIVYANRGAQALCASRDGVALAAGITLARRRDNDRLQALIGAASTPGITPTDGAMQVSRPSGKRPYSIVVSRVSGAGYALTARRPAVCIVINDPEKKLRSAPGLLRAAFALTVAEARLAAEMVSGASLRTAAENLEITYGTARARLAEIFRKTETHRQAELVKLLLTTIN